MVGANALTVINNMRNDSSGLTALAVGIGLVVAIVIIVVLEIRRCWKERKGKK